MDSVSKQHLKALTGLRGYAALWVVFFHFKGNAGVGGVLDLGQWANYGAWGVEIFFVLSGFVLSYVYASQFENGIRPRAYLHYLALRLGRIYPLHVMLLLFFGVLVYGGFLLGISPSHPENFKLADLTWSLLLLHAWGVTDALNWNYVSWSISAEWFAYLFLLPVYVLAGKQLSPLMLLAVAAVSWAVFFIYGATDNQWQYREQWEYAIWRICNDFFLGYALYRFWLDKRIADEYLSAAFVLSVAVIVGLSYSPGEWRILLLPAVALMILSLASQKGIGQWFCANRTAMFMGEISYAIYMIHPAVQVMSNAIVRRLGLGGTEQVACLILLVDVIAVIIGSTIAYYLIEHPFRGWVRRKLS